MHELDQLDTALREAIFGFANVPVTEPMTLTVSTEALTALDPQPADEVDELIASVGAEWPVKVVSWTEAIQ